MDSPRILGLLFTPGMTIDIWKKKGLLSRELDYYKELNRSCPIFDEIWFFTWDTEVPRDLDDILRPLKIRVIPRPKWVGGWWYGLFLPLLQARKLRRVSVMRSQRVLGGALLPMVRLAHGVPTLLRGGFLPSEAPNRRDHPLWRQVLYRIHDWTAYSLNTYVAATSPHERDHVRMVLHVIRPDIPVMPNYVDTDKFAPNGPREPGYVLFVGRVHPEKRIDQLMRAVSLVPGAHLHVVGDGPHRRELEALARDLSLDVEFTGFVDHDKLPEYYAKASVFVQPSASDGNPKNLLEAMACGVPCIATDMPAMSDMAKNEVEALLIDINPENIAQAIRRVLNDQELAASLSRNARKRALAQWSLHSEVEKHCRLYREAMGLSGHQ